MQMVRGTIRRSVRRGLFLSSSPSSFTPFLCLVGLCNARKRFIDETSHRPTRTCLAKRAHGTTQIAILVQLPSIALLALYPSTVRPNHLLSTTSLRVDPQVVVFDMERQKRTTLYLPMQQLESCLRNGIFSIRSILRLLSEAEELRRDQTRYRRWEGGRVE